MPNTPRKQVKNSGGGKSSFQQYERDTEDAWDDGDDDLLMRLKLDTNFIQSTASQIIDSHSNSSPVKPHIQNSSRGRPFLCWSKNTLLLTILENTCTCVLYVVT